VSGALEPTETRVTSRDGTAIAWWTSGHGPPLVLVHGAMGDHTRWAPLLPHLEPHVTAHAVDRRGRGASGDAPRYELARESEDVAAVVDAIAETSGSQVDVYGHSHGGFCAFGAAGQTSNIRRLVLYEGWPVPEPEVYALPADVEARMDALLAMGDRDRVVETAVLAYGMSGEELAGLRAAPSWPRRVAAAHTIVRECRAEAQAKLDLAAAATITAPVLLIVGAESLDPSKPYAGTLASALPDARVLVLEGQGHLADAFAPEAVARHLLGFLSERP
jgi:pimeloyl-ACP methyl ester carboxylesterase